MSPVQIESSVASVEEYRIAIKSYLIDAAIEEIVVGVNLCNVPSKDEIEVASSYNPLQWDSINSLNTNTI